MKSHLLLLPAAMPENQHPNENQPTICRAIAIRQMPGTVTKIALYLAACHTDLSARPGCDAPRFCPTRVAPALPSPPRRQQREFDQPLRDHVSGDRGAAVQRDDTHDCYLTGGGNKVVSTMRKSVRQWRQVDKSKPKCREDAGEW